MGNILRTLRRVNALTPERRRELLDAQQPREEWAGPRGSVAYLKNAQGYEIASYYWPASTPNPKGVVVLVHGQGAYLVFEYCTAPPGSNRPKRYAGSWVQRMNEAGYSVAGMDNQGTGRSGGLFGYVASFDHFVDDLLQLCKTLQASGAPAGFGPGLPVFALGCSLGGCIALHASIRQPSLFRGLVLLAPMLSLERVKRQGANRVLAPISLVLSALVPTLPIVATPKNCKYPDLQSDWDADPVTYHYPTRVRIAAQLLAACDWLGPRMRGVAAPLLVFHSENDTMTDPDGSKLLLSRAAAPDKTLRLCNTFWHIISKEPGNEVVLKEALAWMDARLAPAAAAAAAAGAPAPALVVA
ncbi:MAG: Alpha/Beta hydrolase protein [Monoraphidium minutum]|nr:MAG: Alpha/Beta hydrolase protein [Monoraphidium minutum]